MIAAVSAVLWGLFLVRFYYLQIVSHEELKTAAALQYQVVADGLDTRGMILDRNLQPLTGGVQQYYYFIPEGDGFRDAGWQNELQGLLAAVSARRVSVPDRTGSMYSVYRTQIFDGTVNRKLKQEYGAYVFSCASRYSDSQTACHLIGYLNEAEKQGVYGLEKAYEDRLKSNGSRLTLWAGGSGMLLLDVPPSREGGQPVWNGNLVTSLDAGVQKACETAVENRSMEGAVLVSDVSSGEILAWVSAPDFNPNAVTVYLGSGESNLINKCIQGTYAPGSVFKIVLAAAALESGRIDPEETYLCCGETEAGGVTLGCRAGPEGGHGEVNLYEAMAVSCNCYFAELGEVLGTEEILDMAGKLGFGQKVFSVFEEEAEGFLPAAEETGLWDISNLSIGQGQLLVTPVQVHRMISAVANGGLLVPLTVMTGDEEDAAVPAKRVFSEQTAAELSAMLRQVMVSGTGSGPVWTCPVWGKTGTAETGSAEMGNNCWFSGFCRVEDRYCAVTVLAEGGTSGAADCLPVFQDICTYLTVRQFRAE